MGRDRSAAVLPLHYVSEEQLSYAFDLLDKPGVAAVLRERIPHEARMRSGDLGEILATEYIVERTEYVVHVRRLLWKDTRDMPMRGDDVLGIHDRGDGGPLRFLKTEAKSRASLSRSVITQARESLDRDNGSPSPHSLSYMADQLFERDESELAKAIIRAQLVTGVRPKHVEHLMFTFSGNAPEQYLTAGLTAYTKNVPQKAVGLQIEGHRSFVDSVFNQAISGQHES